jgi:hypothetical protein
MTAVTILKNTRRQAVVRAIGPGTRFANLTALLYSNINGAVDQTFDRANANCRITDVIFSVDGNVTIGRSGDVVIALTTGQGEFSLSQDFGTALDPIRTTANSNIQINFGTANGTVILSLSKSEGFNDPDRQNLEERER